MITIPLCPLFCPLLHSRMPNETLRQQKYLARHYRLVDIEITCFPFATPLSPSLPTSLTISFFSCTCYCRCHLPNYTTYTQQIIIIWCAVVGFHVMLLIEQRWCSNSYLKKKGKENINRTMHWIDSGTDSPYRNASLRFKLLYYYIIARL